MCIRIPPSSGIKTGFGIEKFPLPPLKKKGKFPNLNLN